METMMASPASFVRNVREPRQRRGHEVVSCIMKACEKLLATSTTEEHLGVEQLSRASGISIGSIYRFFPSIEAVFIAIADRMTADDARRLSELRQKGHSLPHALVTIMKDHKEVRHTLDRALAGRFHDVWLESQADVLATFGSDDVDVKRARAHALLGILRSYWRGLITEGSARTALSQACQAFEGSYRAA
jgi:AcrR family transcriptional regulator